MLKYFHYTFTILSSVAITVCSTRYGQPPYAVHIQQRGELYRTAGSSVTNTSILLVYAYSHLLIL